MYTIIRDCKLQLSFTWGERFFTGGGGLGVYIRSGWVTVALHTYSRTGEGGTVTKTLEIGRLEPNESMKKEIYFGWGEMARGKNRRLL